MTEITARPIRWRARKDGLGHAYRNGERNRAMCGEAALEERLAWPSTRRCFHCLQILGERDS